jgi:tetratricopeptide (TPR) repeat protein
VPNDRAAIARHAEQLVRMGRLDEAIGEYRRLLDEQPRDWSTANLLGDLLLKAGRVSDAVGLFTRAAETLAAAGFAARATAIYRKILKLQPEGERALIRAAELSADQGHLADARAFYQAAARTRQARGDDRGAAEIASRVAAFEGGGQVRRAGASAPPQPASIDVRVDDNPPPAERTRTGDPVDDMAHPAADSSDVVAANSGHDVLADSGHAVSADAGPDIEEVFARLRRDRTGGGGDDAAEVAYTRGVALMQAGDTAGGIEQLRYAVRSPRHRFAAAIQLAEGSRTLGRDSDAIDWLGDALDAPEIDDEQRCTTLLKLATLLEEQGETARALAACLELQAYGGTSPDIDQRIARLTRAQAGG